MLRMASAFATVHLLLNNHTDSFPAIFWKNGKHADIAKRTLSLHVLLTYAHSNHFSLFISSLPIIEREKEYRKRNVWIIVYKVMVCVHGISFTQHCVINSFIVINLALGCIFVKGDSIDLRFFWHRQIGPFFLHAATKWKKNRMKEKMGKLTELSQNALVHRESSGNKQVIYMNYSRSSHLLINKREHAHRAASTIFLFSLVRRAITFSLPWRSFTILFIIINIRYSIFDIRYSIFDIRY